MIVIVGAGAAGLMAAIFAATGREAVTLLESTRDGGRKILISGGGRCNILPSSLAPERFVTDSPAHLLRGLLRSWPLVKQREFFEREVGVALMIERETGKLFPVSNRAREVRDNLLNLARTRGVQIEFDTVVCDLHRSGNDWIVVTNNGALPARRVVLATGGLSVPSTGSDGAGLRVASALGHRVHPTYPALTPLTASPAVHASLSGVSLIVRIRAKSKRERVETRGGFLFTHRGYSGPAVLDASHVAVRSQSQSDRAVVRVQWSQLSEADWQHVFGAAEGSILNAIARHLPQRLASTLTEEAGVSVERRAADLRRHERVALLERLTSYVLPWTGDEGFNKAEVTGGGVALDEVDSQTMESRLQPGLFLCGEMLDAFGPIGGHNFAWAWATGRAAGLGAARSPS